MLQLAAGLPRRAPAGKAPLRGRRRGRARLDTGTRRLGPAAADGRPSRASTQAHRDQRADRDRRRRRRLPERACHQARPRPGRRGARAAVQPAQGLQAQNRKATQRDRETDAHPAPTAGRRSCPSPTKADRRASLCQHQDDQTSRPLHASRLTGLQLIATTQPPEALALPQTKPPDTTRLNRTALRHATSNKKGPLGEPSCALRNSLICRDFVGETGSKPRTSQAQPGVLLAQSPERPPNARARTTARPPKTCGEPGSCRAWSTR